LSEPDMNAAAQPRVLNAEGTALTVGADPVPYPVATGSVWGVCASLGAFAYVVWDEFGVTSLEIGLPTEREAACRALAALRAHGLDCSASFRRDDASAARIFAAALAGGSLAMHVVCTPFQLAVWCAARAIPRGETRTYARLAADIGHIGAARAVARALAANPVALVIPCHRVVPASGRTGSYRWGAKFKARLLADEKKAVS
jgi:O-6-methylguanine DNA methyltransferase